jgi:hypothetical protein
VDHPESVSTDLELPLWASQVPVLWHQLLIASKIVCVVLRTLFGSNLVFRGLIVKQLRENFSLKQGCGSGVSDFVEPGSVSYIFLRISLCSRVLDKEAPDNRPDNPAFFDIRYPAG